ncbi:MAG: hypothetical protein GVY23_04030 [Spirochaetes bacterium]|jgi:hypothetical protein|nr:hypothetical protein [Spirochaetota bacterium]
MSDLTESKIMDGNIAYFKFNKGAGAEDFQQLFPDFQTKVQDPSVDKMIVDVQMDDAWNKSIQEIWLQTGKVADDAGIKRWGVVTAEPGKTMTINFLIKGGKERNRSYETYVSENLDDVLKWIRS